MVKVVKLKLPVPTPRADEDEHARADTERRQRLFDWADAVLKRLGLAAAMKAARAAAEVRSVTFDADSAEVVLAIRDALHPASGHRQEHFRGLKEGSLKQILKNRFAELRKAREKELRRGKQKQPDWEEQLILDKDGRVIANLANLTLILRDAPESKGVLSFDEFNSRVVIKKPGPLERTARSRVASASLVPAQGHQSIGWRCWTRSTGSGSTQPVPPGARLFRVACLGRSAPRGILAPKLLPRRRQ
jgi:hypothetical protein